MDLKTRAVNMLRKPAAEWPIIAGERTTIGELITGYAAPLAAIPAVCSFIGTTVIGVPVPFGGTVRLGIASALAGAILSWVFALVGAYLAAIIVEKLAPQFNSRGDLLQAMKLVVFAYTPVWLAGVLNLVPALSVLIVLAAFYAMYLFYLGLPPVMNTPPASVVPYMAVTALVCIVVAIVLGLIASVIARVGGGVGPV
jgi:Yip1-like protein